MPYTTDDSVCWASSSFLSWWMSYEAIPLTFLFTAIPLPKSTPVFSSSLCNNSMQVDKLSDWPLDLNHNYHFNHHYHRHHYHLESTSSYLSPFFAFRAWQREWAHTAPVRSFIRGCCKPSMGSRNSSAMTLSLSLSLTLSWYLIEAHQ